MPLIWVPKSIANPNPNSDQNPNPNSNQNPKSIENPNPNFMSMTESSSSNPPKSNPNYNNKRKNRRNKSRKLKKPKTIIQIKSNWLDLPEDVWFVILSKIYTVDIIVNVQIVCRLFRKLCMQPRMFRIINMTLPDVSADYKYDVNRVTRLAVDRSDGELVDIYLEHSTVGETITYIVDRSKNLKHLRLAYLDSPALIEAVQKVPMLEELEIIRCFFYDFSVGPLGCACPALKSFSLNYVRSNISDEEHAYEIARNMPNLRRLQLIGNEMSNEGLKAILDGCPLLESLDIRACFNIDLSEDLCKRCEKIKHFRRPSDSTADYSYQAWTDDDVSDYYCWGDEPEIEYDSDDFGRSDFNSEDDYDDLLDM